MKVPLVDLRASLEPIRAELFREFETILDSMNLFLGPNTREFEREFAQFIGTKHGIAVSNGTDALAVALRACEIGAGSEVIVPSHTFFATVEAVIHTGATPVFVDIEPRTLTLEPDRVRAAVTPATKAILPVHLYGHPAEMDPILDIARERNLRIIEDCAQAHGARYKGTRCGNIGDAGTFSFYFTKNLGAFGEGGFVTTNDEAIADRIRQLRHHGHVSKYEHARVGYNLRMDEMQAAVLRLKLRRLEENNRRRVAIAARYDSLLSESGIRTLEVGSGCDPVYHLYPIRVDARDAMQAYLEEQGIGTGIHYKIPTHSQPALRAHPHRSGDLAVTDETCRKLLSIPMFPEMSEDQVEYVADQIRTFLRDSSRSAS